MSNRVITISREFCSGGRTIVVHILQYFAKFYIFCTEITDT